MWHTYATTVGLALPLLGLASPLVFAQEDSPVSRGVVATITTLDANTGMATLKTEAGEVFEVWQRSLWTRGDKVLCDLIGGSYPRLQRCQLWQVGDVPSPAPRAGRFVDTEPPRRAEQPEPRGAVPAPRREIDTREDVGVFGWRTTVPGDGDAQ